MMDTQTREALRICDEFVTWVGTHCLPVRRRGRKYEVDGSSDAIREMNERINAAWAAITGAFGADKTLVAAVRAERAARERYERTNPRHSDSRYAAAVILDAETGNLDAALAAAGEEAERGV